ncbi:MAG: arabinosyltransferase domain-containing protein, partial [Mycobacterium sp.]|nr:arabinosyltransferase domain-containing protein [Mycobacterium sp.]
MTDTPTTDAPSTGTRAPRIDHRTARIVAVVAGLLGFLMALVTPLLPVNQSTAELNWPQGEQVGDVAAPLVSYAPIDMDVTVPCAMASDLPDTGGMLLSTIPAGGQDAAARALMIRATQDALLVTDRDVVILNTPRAAAQANPNCRIVFHADGDGVNARIDNVTGDGQHTFSVPDHELRPQIVGVYTDLPATASREGLSLHATIDTRYVSTPAPLKVAVIVLGILMTILSLIALGILDRADGRSHKRFLPSGWWTIRGPDIAVLAILAFWWIGGANTSDDGYNFTVGRIAGEAGYADNYFRYFGVPQDPFGW